MRRTALMALGLIASVFFTTEAAGQRKFLVPMPGRIAPEGSHEECIYKQLQQGLSITQAIDACGVQGFGHTNAQLLDPSNLFGAFGRKGTGLTIARCPTSRADPRRAAGNDDDIAPVSDLDLEKYLNQIRVFKVARQAAYDEAMGTRTPEQKNAALAAVDGINDEISRQFLRVEPAAEAIHFKAEKDKADPSPPAGDFPAPDPNKGTARGARDYESPCSQALLFIAECNRDGWRSSDCKSLLDRMNKCLDRTVADPANPEETTCALPAVDAAKVQDVMMALCSSKKRFGPDNNPCDARILKGTARTYWSDTNKVNECSDPNILRSEACTPALTVVEFGVPDLDKIRKAGLNKLGGPIFIFPVGSPRDAGGPAPKPPPFGAPR